jgi:hypothetical protein
VARGVAVARGVGEAAAVRGEGETTARGDGEATARGEGEGEGRGEAARAGVGEGVGDASGVPGFGYSDAGRSEGITTLGSERSPGSEPRKPRGGAEGSCASANGALAAMMVMAVSNFIFI